MLRVGGSIRWIGAGLALTMIVSGSISGLAQDRLRPTVKQIKEQPVAPTVGELSPHGFTYVGSLTCNARGCHGGIEPPGEKGSEFTNWLREDRHAQAFTVLSEPRSTGIEARFRRLAPDKADASTDPLCLSCHGLPQESGHLPIAAGGVGCESCHGPAGNWLNQHYGAAWKSKSAQDKAKLGLVDLSNAVDQARTCMPCHVGDLSSPTGKEVNHDLIAAGHPRLLFEFSAFMEQMPRHWDHNKPTDPAIRRWIVGQVAAAESAVKLLSTRSTENHVWPEFAEFDCFACHHDLRNEWFRFEKAPRPGLGQPGWRTGELAFLRFISGSEAPAARAALAKLDEAMEPGLIADPRELGPAAESARVALETWLDGLKLKSDATASALHADNLQSLIAGVSPEEAEQFYGYWEAATQFFRASAALSSEKNSPELDATLKDLLEALTYPRGQDSPALKFPSESLRGATLNVIKAVKALPPQKP